MAVDFGKPKQSMIGKSKLTKSIQQGFTVSCSQPDIEPLWEVADGVCQNYPRKRSLLGPRGAMVFFPRGNKIRSIGYGTISGDGPDAQISPDWTLRITGAAPNYAIELVQAKIVSGKIDQAKEMEFFLNELEDALRKLDSRTTITVNSP